MVQKILAGIGVLAILLSTLFVGFVGGVRTSDEMYSHEDNVVAQVERGINQAQSSTYTQSGHAATDWERVCKGLEAYVYDSGQLPSRNPCGPDVFFVVDAPWNGADTNAGQFFVTSNYATVLDSQKVWPNGSLWVTDTMDYVAQNMGDWCAGNAPKIVETTTSWSSCGGDFIYVLIDPWKQGGVTNPGTRYEFATIEQALNWMEQKGLDSGSIWVELPGYSK